MCSNCERLGFPCSYDNSTAAALDTNGVGGAGGAGSAGSADNAALALGVEAGDDGHSVLMRRRARQACQNCHLRKARCSGGTPACDRCQALGIECVYRLGRRSRIRSVSGSAGGGDVSGNENLASNCGHSRPSGHLEADPSQPGAAGAAGAACADGAENGARLLSVDILESMAMKTFDQFFGHIHHIPTFAFLHRSSLMQRFHAGLVEKSLLLALVGITSLMTDLGPGTRSLGTRCIAEAETLVLGQLERPSTLALQTLVFVIHHRILSGRFSSAFMLHGIASRFASALRLDHEDLRLCFLARESRRRLMWAIYMIDVSMASMASRQIDSSLWLYKSDVIRIQLPCNERNFEFDIPEISEPLQPPEAAATQTPPPLPDSTGFLALHVRIHFLRGRILQYTKHVVHNYQAADVANIPVRCAELTAELEAFAARLPASFRWSEANVRLRTYSPRLCVFLMTHVWWEQCCCELYRFALPGLGGALPAACAAQLEAECQDFVHHCLQQAYKHAMAMIGIFRLLLALDSGIPVTDLDLPICLDQCARLLHYFSRAGGYESTVIQEREQASEGISICVQVLERCIKTPATLRIHANLERFVAREVDMQLAPNVPGNADLIIDVETGDLASGLFQPPLTSDAASQALRTTEYHEKQTGGYLGIAQAHDRPMVTDPAISLHVENHTPAIETTTTATAMAAATAVAAAVTTPWNGPAAPATVSPVTTSIALSATESLRPILASQSALDAFDLDVDAFGSSEFATWFANDWPTTEFSTCW